MVTFIFGDSIAQGMWDELGGWANRLIGKTNKKTVAAKFDPYFEVYNLGVFGDRTSELLIRLESEIRARHSLAMQFVYAIGINDAAYINEEKVCRTTQDEFAINLEKIIKISRKYGKKICFVGLTPVDQPAVDPMPWDEEKSYRNEDIDKYNGIIENVCEKKKVLFIDTLGPMKKRYFQAFLADGVHPNTAGHLVMWEIVWKKLLEYGFF